MIRLQHVEVGSFIALGYLCMYCGTLRQYVYPRWCALWDNVTSRSSVIIYIYIYMYVHSLYEFWYRTYTYTTGVSFSIGEAAPHHVLWDCISGECTVPGLNATFCFLLFTNWVLLFDKSLILGCLWPLVFVLNNTLILGIWCSTIPHLPGCFCPWTFFGNIGFNTVVMDPFMSHLATQLGYSAGEFQAYIQIQQQWYVGRIW